MPFSKKRKNKWTRIAAMAFVVLLLGVLGGCAFFASTTEPKPDSENVPPKEDQPIFPPTTADLDTDSSQAIPVDLSEAEGNYTISQAGAYLLSGDLKGCILIDAEEQIVHLILNQVSVQSDFGPALSVVSAGKVILTLCPDTVNVFRDSARYDDSGEENSCIYSICDLTVNGNGALDVQGYYKDGIHSKDVIKILDGTLSIRAKRDGIRGNDGISVCCPQMSIESEGNGLHTTKTGRGQKGSIELYNGDHSVIAGEYAISSAADLWISDCRLFANSILSSTYAAGRLSIQEGCLENE